MSRPEIVYYFSRGDRVFTTTNDAFVRDAAPLAEAMKIVICSDHISDICDEITANILSAANELVSLCMVDARTYYHQDHRLSIGDAHLPKLGYLRGPSCPPRLIKQVYFAKGEFTYYPSVRGKKCLLSKKYGGAWIFYLAPDKEEVDDPLAGATIYSMSHISVPSPRVKNYPATLRCLRNSLSKFDVPLNHLHTLSVQSVPDNWYELWPRLKCITTGAPLDLYRAPVTLESVCCTNLLTDYVPDHIKTINMSDTAAEYPRVQHHVTNYIVGVQRMCKYMVGMTKVRIYAHRDIRPYPMSLVLLCIDKLPLHAYETNMLIHCPEFVPCACRRRFATQVKSVVCPPSSRYNERVKQVRTCRDCA